MNNQPFRIICKYSTSRMYFTTKKPSFSNIHQMPNVSVTSGHFGDLKKLRDRSLKL